MLQSDGISDYILENPLQVDKTTLWDKIHPAVNIAEVAELADALRSGRSELTLMRVQVPPSALPMKLAEKRVFLLPLQGESE